MIAAGTTGQRMLQIRDALLVDSQQILKNRLNCMPFLPLSPAGWMRVLIRCIFVPASCECRFGGSESWNLSGDGGLKFDLEVSPSIISKSCAIVEAPQLFDSVSVKGEILSFAQEV
jgi:hypothetical protein